MLSVIVKGVEEFNEETSTFVSKNDVSLTLEHSLASVSKWESIYLIPFMTDAEKTPAQMIDYIKCMTLSDDIPEEVYHRLSVENLKVIYDYIAKNVTATKIFTGPGKEKPSQETITAELIYYWMVAFNIPFECQYWHLDKLLTLIKVANVKNNPDKKVSKADRAQWMREQNAARQKQYGTAG